MSIFDAINATAEASYAAKKAANGKWWRNRDLWQDFGTCHSLVEVDALKRIVNSCPINPDEIPFDLNLLMATHQLRPLRVYLEARGETLFWRKPGLRPAAFVVPLAAGS